MNFYILSPEALQDLNEIVAYIEEKNPQAAVQFLDNFAHRCRNLAAFPNMGRKWNALTPPLRSFPIDTYLIFYRPIEDGIEVMRILSGYRDLDNIFSSESDS